MPVAPKSILIWNIDTSPRLSERTVFTDKHQANNDLWGGDLKEFHKTSVVMICERQRNRLWDISDLGSKNSNNFVEFGTILRKAVSAFFRR